MFKQIILLASSLLITFNSFADNGRGGNPTWFDIALTGSGGTSMLTSKNMFKDTKTVTTSFSDMISVDRGKGSTVSYPLNDVGSSKTFDCYSAFKATTVQLHTEFTFDLGYFAKASCKRGRIGFMKMK